jgi:aminocarboxymuconate-semialdehyde decarboxylase
MRIDVHNHALPRELVELLRRESVYGVQIDGDTWNQSHGVTFEITNGWVDPDAKLDQLEQHGIGGAVLSALPVFYSGLPADALQEVCEVTNEGLAGYQRAWPERFRWAAHVPIAFPERAAATLLRAHARGAVGAHVPTHVAGLRLDHAMFEPFWATVDELRLPVLIHPSANEPHAGLADWYLQNVIGNQLETTITIERLICSGVLDRYPSVRVILVHGGGYFPFQAGRLRHAASVRPELADAPRDPWRYRDRIFVDSITHDGDALAFLVHKMTSDNVLLGTDIPFDMATPDPVAALVEAVGVETARVIAEDNPGRLFAFAPDKEVSRG